MQSAERYFIKKESEITGQDVYLTQKSPSYRFYSTDPINAYPMDRTEAKVVSMDLEAGGTEVEVVKYQMILKEVE